MNISSSVCWTNSWDSKTLINIGPDVVAIRQGNLLKFLNVTTMAMTYFKAETVATGLYIGCCTGHNRFPLFAFSETVLRPLIHVYKYPEMAKFGTLPAHLISYHSICFSEYDLIVGLGGHPLYTLCVFNYRTGNLVVDQPTNVPVLHRSLLLSNHNLPIIVQFNKRELSIICYEMCFVEKESYLHKVSEVELGKSYVKSVGHFMCFGDDNGLYVVDDFGELSQIDIACFLIKSRWAPRMVTHEGVEIEPQHHQVIAHKMGFLISNSQRAYYVKKKSGTFTVEWTIDDMVPDINLFLSNSNGELYAEREHGSIYQAVVTDNEGYLRILMAAGEPITTFVIVNGLKDEGVLLLHPEKLTMVDMQHGFTLCEVPINNVNYMDSHHTLPFVIAGTMDARLLLVQFERTSLANVVFELQCETEGVVRMQYHDNSVVFMDQNKVLHVVTVDYKPPRLRHYFSIANDDLIKEAFVQSFRLVEGPRLLVFITRDKEASPPGYATELWLYKWGRERRLQRRDYALPRPYVSICITPPMGRWVQVEFIAVAKESTSFDLFTLNEANDLQWHASIKTPHYGLITGCGITKQLLTWGVDGIMLHFRQHKRSKSPFMVSRYLKLLFRPNLMVRAMECFNSKYLIVLLPEKRLRVMRLHSLADNIRENTELPIEEEAVHVEQINMVTTPIVPIVPQAEVKEVEYTRNDYYKREKVNQMIAEFGAKVTALIDYDISVTGKTQGIFKKFCFHYSWLDAVTEEARKLCILERKSLERAIEDQSRIRDWIIRLVTKDAININYKVRSIFADANFESFAMPRKPNMAEFDKYRFYDLEDHMRLSVMSMESEEAAPPPPPQSERPPWDEEEGEEEEEEEKGFREMKPYVVEGPSVYDHIMAPIFQLQDKNIVTSNQIFNMNCKFRYYLNEPLKQEFNKLFHEAQQLKQDTIDSVLNTNAVLYKIYDNMNIMLRLLNMEEFVPPELSVPELAKDEVIKRIMEVDDSEIKAINRRKRKTIDTGPKRGRLLLWSVEFWARALIVMMDGVIEKLWEEEIKKDIPEPEFMSKKQPHEYSLEDQKVFRAWEEAVRQLGEDRRKYLRILHENEGKTLEVKTQQILRLNKRVAELMQLKLKYDFAVKQNRVRMLNLKTVNFARSQLRKRINLFRNDMHKLTEYINRYGNLFEFWERSLADVRTRLEGQQSKDRAVERHFRSNFLNTVPQSSHEMTKLFKKRPKLTTKLFGSSLMCMETAHKLTGKQSQRNIFPLPQDIYDFLAVIDELDLAKNCPQQVDAKSWDTFIKLRRQKIESELRLKGLGYQVLDNQTYLNNLTKDIAALKESNVTTQKHMEASTQQYLEVMRNMTLQLTLSLGQVEVSAMGSTKSLSGTVLMHVDDITEINRQIKDAGNKKIKAMERVAIFRRQVIFKEWEHKLYKANIAYLKYMLDAIEKCRVTMEFLNILRNWEKVKAQRQKFMAAGAIERVIEEKIAAFKKHIERVNIKIDIVKAKTLEIKRDNHSIDTKIERLKVDVTFQNSLRDVMMEERRDREQQERMAQIKTHRRLLDNVRRNYAHVLELQTILELLRLRTYPTLGPPLPQCHPPVPDSILNSVIQ